MNQILNYIPINCFNSYILYGCEPYIHMFNHFSPVIAELFFWLDLMFFLLTLQSWKFRIFKKMDRTKITISKNGSMMSTTICEQ